MKILSPAVRSKAKFGLSMQSRFLADLLEAVRLKDQTVLNELNHFQIIIDRLIGKSERLISTISEISQTIPINFHSVGLNLASPTGPSMGHINKVSEVLKHFRPNWISDHLCLTHSESGEFHGLIPIPYSIETAKVVSSNIKFLKREFNIPVAIENITFYAPIDGSELTETELITEVISRSECHILLDLNNLFLNHYNFQSKSNSRRKEAIVKSILYLNEIPLDRIIEVHIAGFGRLGKPRLNAHHDLLIDTHGSETEPEIIELLQILIAKIPQISITLEREANVPTLRELLSELSKIRYLVSKEGDHVDAE